MPSHGFTKLLLSRRLTSWWQGAREYPVRLIPRICIVVYLCLLDNWWESCRDLIWLLLLGIEVWARVLLHGLIEEVSLLQLLSRVAKSASSILHITIKWRLRIVRLHHRSTLIIVHRHYGEGTISWEISPNWSSHSGASSSHDIHSVLPQSWMSLELRGTLLVAHHHVRRHGVTSLIIIVLLWSHGLMHHWRWSTSIPDASRRHSSHEITILLLNEHL